MRIKQLLQHVAGSRFDCCVKSDTGDKRRSCRETWKRPSGEHGAVTRRSWSVRNRRMGGVSSEKGQWAGQEEANTEMREESR